jgi:hypothetical protein
MGTTAQARAVKNYRKRLNKRGMARFEVVGLSSDRELIRKLARKLAEESRQADEIRASMESTIAEHPQKTGGVLAALRRWPIADLELTRPYTEGRKIDL